MTGALFGAPAGLFRRLDRSEVRVPDVRAAVSRLTAGGLDPLLELQVLDGVRGPLLVLDEAGRTTRVLLGELAAEMTRARVPATPEGVTAALAAWLARRPVPDRLAAAGGIAVLVRPEVVLAGMAGRGLRLHDPHVVVTPRRPVACADAPVARRLVAEAADASVTIPWRELADLGWA